MKSQFIILCSALGLFLLPSLALAQVTTSVQDEPFGQVVEYKEGGSLQKIEVKTAIKTQAQFKLSLANTSTTSSKIFTLSSTSNWLQYDSVSRGKAFDRVTGRDSVDEKTITLPASSNTTTSFQTAKLIHTGNYVSYLQGLSSVLPLHLNLQECVTSQSGNLLDPATYDGGSICGKQQTSAKIASGHTVVWNSTPEASNVIHVQDGGILELAYTGTFQGQVVLEKGATLKITQDTTLSKFKMTGDATIQIADSRTVEIPHQIGIPFHQTLTVSGGRLKGERMVIYGTLTTDQTIIENQILVANGTIQTQKSSQILGAIQYADKALKEQPNHLLKDFTPIREDDRKMMYAIHDFDGDGDQDLFARDVNHGLIYYRNVGTLQKPKFERKQIPRGIYKLYDVGRSSWTYSIETLYENQIPKYIAIGAIGVRGIYENIGNATDWNLKLLDRTLVSSTPVYFMDVNGDHTYELVLNWLDLEVLSLKELKFLYDERYPFYYQAILDVDGDRDPDMFSIDNDQEVLTYHQNIRYDSRPIDAEKQKLYDSGDFLSRWQHSPEVFPSHAYKESIPFIRDLNDDQVPELYLLTKLNDPIQALEFFPYDKATIFSDSNESVLKLAESLTVPEYSKLEISGSNIVIQGDLNIHPKLTLQTSTHVQGNISLYKDFTAFKDLTIAGTTTINGSLKLDLRENFSTKNLAILEKFNPLNTPTMAIENSFGKDFKIEKQLTAKHVLLGITGGRVFLPEVIDLEDSALMIVPNSFHNSIKTLNLASGNVTLNVNIARLNSSGTAVVSNAQIDELVTRDNLRLRNATINNNFHLNDPNALLKLEGDNTWKGKFHLEKGTFEAVGTDTTFEAPVEIATTATFTQQYNRPTVKFQQSTTLSGVVNFETFDFPRDHSIFFEAPLTISGALKNTGNLRTSDTTLIQESGTLTNNGSANFQKSLILNGKLESYGPLYIGNIEFGKGQLFSDGVAVTFASQETLFQREPETIPKSGIGVALVQLPTGTFQIHSILPGGAADKHGFLKPQDSILQVSQDGITFESVVGWTMADLISKLTGPEDSTVWLEINRQTPSALVTHKINLVRKPVIQREVTARFEESGISTTKPSHTWKIGKHAKVEVEGGIMRKIAIPEIQGELSLKNVRWFARKDISIASGGILKNEGWGLSFDNLKLDGILESKQGDLDFRQLTLGEGVLRIEGGQTKFPIATSITFTGQHTFRNVDIQTRRTGSTSVWNIGKNTKLSIDGGSVKDIELGEIQSDFSWENAVINIQKTETTVHDKITFKNKGGDVRFKHFKLDGTFENTNGNVAFEKLTIGSTGHFQVTGGTMKFPIATSVTFTGQHTFRNVDIQTITAGSTSVWNIGKNTKLSIDGGSVKDIELGEIQSDFSWENAVINIQKTETTVHDKITFKNKGGDVRFKHFKLDGTFENTDGNVAFEKLTIGSTGSVQATGGTMKFPIATSVTFAGQHTFRNVDIQTITAGSTSVWNIGKNTKLSIDGGSVKDIELGEIQSDFSWENAVINIQKTETTVHDKITFKNKGGDVRFKHFKLDGTFENTDGNVAFERLTIGSTGSIQATGGTMKFPIATSVTFVAGTKARFVNVDLSSLVAGQKSVWFIDDKATVEIIGGSIQDIEIKTGLLSTKGTEDKGGNTNLITGGSGKKTVQTGNTKVSVPADEIKENPDKSVTFTKKTKEGKTETTLYSDGKVQIKKTTTRQGKQIETEVEAPPNSKTDTDEKSGITVTESQLVQLSRGRTSQTKTSLYPDGKVKHETIITSSTGQKTITETKVPEGVKVEIASSGYSAIAVSDFLDVADPKLQVEVTKIESLIGLEGRTQTLIYTQDQDDPTVIDAPLAVKTQIHPLATVQQYIPSQLVNQVSSNVYLSANRKGQLFSSYHTKDKDQKLLTAQAYPVFENGADVKASFHSGQGQLILVGQVANPFINEPNLLVGKDYATGDYVHLSERSADFELRIERNLLEPFNQMSVEQGTAFLVQSTQRLPLRNGNAFNTNSEAIHIPAQKDWTLLSLPIQQNLNLLQRELFLAQFSELKVYQKGKWLMETPNGREHHNNVGTLAKNQGFWAKQDEARALNLLGTAAEEAEMSLPPENSGWHLLGVSKTMSLDELQVLLSSQDDPQPTSQALPSSLPMTTAFAFALVLPLVSIRHKRQKLLLGLIVLLLVSCAPESSVPSSSEPAAESEQPVQKQAGDVPTSVIWKQKNNTWQVYSSHEETMKTLQDKGFEQIEKVHAGEGLWINQTWTSLATTTPPQVQ